MTTRVDSDEPATDSARVQVYVALLEFPRGRIVDEVVGSVFDRSRGEEEQTIEVDASDTNTWTKYHYLVGLVPAGTTIDSIDYTELTTIMETDSFELSSGRTQIERSGYEGQLDDDSGQNYSRNSVEGAYELEISGRTGGRRWTVGFFSYKSAHAQATERSRGRSRAEYVSYELTDGTAAELATLLKENGEALEYTNHELVEFVIDFVQSLPYVSDDVSKGFDDYTKSSWRRCPRWEATVKTVRSCSPRFSKPSPSTTTWF